MIIRSCMQIGGILQKEFILHRLSQYNSYYRIKAGDGANFVISDYPLFLAHLTGRVRGSFCYHEASVVCRPTLSINFSHFNLLL